MTVDPVSVLTNMVDPVILEPVKVDTVTVEADSVLANRVDAARLTAVNDDPATVDAIKFARMELP